MAKEYIELDPLRDEILNDTDYDGDTINYFLGIVDSQPTITKDEDKIEITPYDSPWEIACRIINAEYEHIDIFKQRAKKSFFDLDDLRKIGEHIVNYCNTEEEKRSDNND